jgi:hypothetical protein
VQYLRFRISNYRAITGPLEINLEQNPLIPIIGVNESGKTTILHAIFAFDSYNDHLLHDGQQLQDTENLYQLRSESAHIAAEISITSEEYTRAITGLVGQVEDAEDDGEDVENDEDDEGDAESATASTVTVYASELQDYIAKADGLPERLWITRDLGTKQYALDPSLFPNPEVNHLLASAIVRRSPYILFFDDFRDSIDEVIPIVKDEAGNATGWLAIFERLFESTDPSLSVFDLAGLDERRRDGAISEAAVRLNETLTREWARFGLDGDESAANNLRLDIQYVPAVPGVTTSLGSLKLQVVERTATGADRYFYLLNRSKGFYWFCNFVLKLEFNPKTLGDSYGAIYLLDEPGSYLHNSAQARLCEKLRQLSERNVVIYCTHSQYLLNPAVIPLSTIQIASKDATGKVSLVPYYEYPTDGAANTWAYQPLWDALGIKPFVTDLNYRRILIVEGITDAYAFEMLAGDPSLGFMPATGAGSMQYLVSLLLGWGVEFAVLWDNDKEGRKQLGDAQKFFGERLAKRRFRLIPLVSRGQKRRALEDLFEASDASMIRERLGFKPRAALKKTLDALYYHPEREAILSDLSTQTKVNFAEVLSSLPLGGGQ